jgi:hypothetical protein
MPILRDHTTLDVEGNRYREMAHITSGKALRYRPPKRGRAARGESCPTSERRTRPRTRSRPTLRHRDTTLHAPALPRAFLEGRPGQTTDRLPPPMPDLVGRPEPQYRGAGPRTAARRFLAKLAGVELCFTEQLGKGGERTLVSEDVQKVAADPQLQPPATPSKIAHSLGRVAWLFVVWALLSTTIAVSLAAQNHKLSETSAAVTVLSDLIIENYYQGTVEAIWGGWFFSPPEPGKRYIVRFGHSRQMMPDFLEGDKWPNGWPESLKEGLWLVETRLEMVPEVRYHVDVTGEVWKSGG